MKITKAELLEKELRGVNEQLYAAYKRIKELKDEIVELEKQIERDDKYIEHLLGECPPDCKFCGE